MSTVLDVIGGVVIGGMLMLIALTTSDIGMRNMFNENADGIVQSNMNRMTRIIEFDLRKMGFAVPEAQLDNTVQIALPGHLKFLAQLNLDADTYYKIPGLSIFDTQVDTIDYFVSPGPSVTLGDTSFSLYNVQRTVKIAGGPTRVTVLGNISNSDVFTYFNQVGQPAFTNSEIRLVDIKLASLNPNVVLSPDILQEEINDIQNSSFKKKEIQRLLRPTFWRQRRLIARNLRR